MFGQELRNCSLASQQSGLYRGMHEFSEVLVRTASMSGSDEPQQSMFGQEIRSGLLVSNRVQKRELYRGK